VVPLLDRPSGSCSWTACIAKEAETKPVYLVKIRMEAAVGQPKLRRRYLPCPDRVEMVSEASIIVKGFAANVRAMSTLDEQPGLGGNPIRRSQLSVVG